MLLATLLQASTEEGLDVRYQCHILSSDERREEDPPKIELYRQAKLFRTLASHVNEMWDVTCLC